LLRSPDELSEVDGHWDAEQSKYRESQHEVGFLPPYGSQYREECYSQRKAGDEKHGPNL